MLKYIKYTMIMDDKHKYELERMIKENETKDQTDSIRERGHSGILRDSILQFYKIKYSYKLNGPDELRRITKDQCEFLFSNYRELYEMLVTKDINLPMMMKLLELLENIETGKSTQHESSFVLGQMLKELYIDPKINTHSVAEEPMKLSWSDYKKMRSHH